MSLSLSNLIVDLLKKEKIYIKDLQCGDYLTTIRHDILLLDGMLSLDENEYNHHHDYEIEFEVSLFFSLGISLLNCLITSSSVIFETTA